MSPTLVALPVMMPLLGAGLTLIARNRTRVQEAISVTTLVAVLGVTVALLIGASDAPMVLRVGGWDAPIGIVLVADRLAALMIIVSAIVTLGVLLYSIGQGLDQDREHAPTSVYHPTYLILVAGVADAFLAGDLFNMYVGFEILLAASYVLLTIGASRDRVRAGTGYVVVSLVSSLIFLTAIAMTYASVGTVNLAQLAIRFDGLDPGFRVAIELLLITAFAIKAAVFPLSAWLPDAYPTAPAPVTAVFAGLLTKVGVYAILRSETLLFPESDVSPILMIAASATMLVGIFGALSQSDMKRALSFTLVSHIGYLLMGIALNSEVGLAGTIFYMAHHILVQTTLFLVVGLVETRSGSTSLEHLGGLARTAPLIAVLFFVPAMNLAGVPPLSGFIGKLGILQGAVAADNPSAWVMLAVSLLTSLLTLYTVAKIWNRAFWQEPTIELEERPLPRSTVAATMGMIGVMLAMSVFAGPLVNLSRDAAHTILQRRPYVEAVLGKDQADQLRFWRDASGEVRLR